MKKYYLWLIKVFGAGNPDLSELITRFGNAKEIYEAFRNNCAAAGSDYAKKAESTKVEEGEKLLSELESKNITVITLEDEFYPKNLKKTENPPAVLFARGNVQLLKNELLTIGGTRKVTEYTIAAETAVCEELCKEYTLVASLCTGCEQLACLTAIKMGKGCIEILPCGHDYEYPKGTHVIRQQLLMNNGCIISEFLPDTKSSNANYLKRARISGGISKAMIIFQASQNSGSLNAAKYSPALFFLPPADVFSDKYSAAVCGVRNGAKLYLSPSSIKTAYADDYVSKYVQLNNTTAPHKKMKEEEIPADFKTPAKEAPLSEETAENINFPSELHKKAYQIIASSEEAVTFDEIYRNFDIDLSEVSEILLDLEIAGLVNAIVGNRFIKA